MHAYAGNGQSSNGYARLEPEVAAAIVAEINPYFTPVGMDPRLTIVASRALSFLPATRAYRLTDTRCQPPVTKHALITRSSTGDDIQVIDFTAASLMAYAARNGLCLNEDNAAGWARFFLSMVQGSSGPIRLVEQPGDIGFASPPDGALLHELQTRISGLRRLRPEPGMVPPGITPPAWIFAASFVHEDVLFSGKIGVARDGTISIFDEEPVITDLPVPAGASIL